MKTLFSFSLKKYSFTSGFRVFKPFTLSSCSYSSVKTGQKYDCDALVIGAGIAGASMSYNLSKNGLKIICIEQEHMEGYHSTGRAAGLFSENYGTKVVQILSMASREWFENPPNDCLSPDQDPILTPAGLVAVSTPENESNLLEGFGPPSEEYAKNNYLAQKQRDNVKIINKEKGKLLYPYLNWDILSDTVIHETSATDLNIPLVHQSYLRGCKNNNVLINLNEKAISIKKDNNNKIYETITNNNNIYKSRLIINCAGPWVDYIAEISNIKPLNNLPLKRSIIVFKPTHMDDINKELMLNNLPWTLGVDESKKEFWYIGRQGSSGLLLASPANRDESEACDAQIDDFDVAICVDRIETYSKYKVLANAIKSKWSGLRVHSPDWNFILGPDPNDSTFIWCGGLAGQGVQACPGYSNLLTQLILGKGVPKFISDLGFDLNTVLPNRFHENLKS